jgi:hypothetical protein
LRAGGLEQRRRDVAAAAVDIGGVDHHAAAGADVEALLEGADAVQSRSVRCLLGKQAELRGAVSDRDGAGEDLVQGGGGVEGETRRVAFGDPAQIHPRQAVGLLLADQRGVPRPDQGCLVLQGVAVFVGQ